MLKSQVLRLLSLLFGISLLLVLTAFALFGDVLFFRSDTASAFLVAVAISCVVFVFLVIAYLALMALSSKFSSNPILYLGHAFTTLIVGNVFYFLLNTIDVKLLVTVRGKYLLSRYVPAFYPEFLWLVLWVLVSVAIWNKLSKAAERQAFAERSSVVASVVSPITLVLFVCVLGSERMSGWGIDENVPSKPRHAVLVVLDGWPSQYMKLFNPHARPKPGDSRLAQGLVFRNVRTNCVWTSCYFGTLYLGSPRAAFSHLSLPRWSRVWNEAFDSKENLIGALQENGVKVRTFHSHRNGLPEGSAARLHNYKGFRSVFLSSLYTSVLHELRLEYTMQFPGPARNTLDEDSRRHVLKKILPSPNAAPYSNILTELLMPEMRRMQKLAPKSFIIFHTGWAIGAGNVANPFDQKPDEGEINPVIRRARLQHYRYDSEDEWYAERLRRSNDRYIEAVEESIGRFIGKLEEEGLLKHTLVIFTADHGSMSSRGKLWYGYHPDEEVTRVPMVVFSEGRSGVDNRNFETIDITRTLVEHFGISVDFDPRARSLFGSGGKPFTSSLTLRSDLNSEWFIAIYKENRKYLFNIHPDGNGLGMEQNVSRFNTVTLTEGEEVIRAVLREFVQTLADFGLSEIPYSEIHPNYAKARLMRLAKTTE